MKLITPVPLEQANFNISHADKLLLIGSCFADNIGTKVTGLKFDALVNPFGIIYNPASIASLLTRIIKLKKFTANELHQNNELWFSFEHHSLLNSIDKLEHLTKINNLLTRANQFLKKANVFIVTLGTAFVYKHLSINKIVANCHKTPNAEFEKTKLSVDEIFTSLNDSLQLLFQFNEKLKIIFTVSPVRHIKDGIENNTKSKATLHLAIENLVNENLEKCTYFPAYEIMMDELRDYRFYKDDLLHPTAFAINYIWEKFERTYCNENTINMNTSISALLQQYYHKPFNEHTQNHKKAQKILIDKMLQFQATNNISFKKEIEQLNNNVNFTR